MGRGGLSSVDVVLDLEKLSASKSAVRISSAAKTLAGLSLDIYMCCFLRHENEGLPLNFNLGKGIDNLTIADILHM